MQRRYITVDVFTDRAFGGNPLAVVLDAGGLTTAQMQAIATEFNYSETTFVLAPRNPAHDAEVRIFTPVRELPFAGHPNVGTGFVLARRSNEPWPRLLFEEKAGVVPVEIWREQGKVVGAELTAPQKLARLAKLSAAEVAACLSLTAGDVRTDRHEPQVVGVGTPFVVAELHSRDALRRAKPDAAAFGRILPRDGAFSVYFYTRDIPAAEAGCDLMARMFMRGTGGFTEDPATGSATVAAAALLAELDPLRDGEVKLTVGQGFDMGRPSILRTTVEKEGGALLDAYVGGHCVQMMEGTFDLVGEA